ncbi:MAG: CHAT domain-containing protein [Labedaea sp.]
MSRAPGDYDDQYGLRDNDRAPLAGLSATAGDPGKAAQLGIARHEDYRKSGDIQLLRAALTCFRTAVDATPSSNPRRPEYLFGLGNALHDWYEHTGRQTDLDQGITCHREAVATIALDNPNRPACLSNLGAALWIRYERTRLQADRDEAIACHREAVDTAPPDHPHRPGFLSYLGNALRARYERTGEQADLDQAITAGQQAVGAIPPDHPERAMFLSNLGAALLTRYGCAGQLADLDRAITCLHEAVDTAPSGHPHRPNCLSNLGIALHDRYEHTGAQADLDQAITCHREAVNATPSDNARRAAYLSNLANVLRARYERTGERADLDQAIIVGQQAVDAIPSDHPDRPIGLSNLGSALRARYEHMGGQADLDQAIACHREAVDATPREHPTRPTYLSNLGTALLVRYRRTRLQPDLDQAIACHGEAVDAVPPGHPHRPACLSNLGIALHNRYEHTRRQADLDEAIACHGEAVDAAPPGHPDRPMGLANLGGVLRTRYGHTGRQADLDQAIACRREAIESAPAEHPNRAGYLSNLGNVLQDRYQLTGQHTDLDQAVAAFRQGALVLTASPGSRLTAAWQWGRCAMLAARPESAAEGYAAAIELLPLVAWHGLDQASREHHLRERAGLASEAAAATLAAGHPNQAVELGEAGRSVLWTQALHLRQDLTELTERAPDLAAALDASRAILNNSSSARSQEAGDHIGRSQAAGQQMLEQRRQAARDWDTAVDRIRQIEGFEHFLRPTPFTHLRTAADGGPVVIVNISRHGSHALIVTPSSGPDSGLGVRIVDLPDAPVGAVADQANVLLTAQRRTSDPSADWQTREADRQAVFSVLEWCWQAITEPVLTALSYTHTPQAEIEDWPRVWWCPTGPATVLPLHAAGRHPRTVAQYKAIGENAAVADTVAGRVISSYTPTLGTLAQTRARPAPRRVRQLAVGVPHPPTYATGAGPLSAVPAELQALASHLPEPECATHLLGSAATRQAVLAALPSHSWLHLSCHGFQHPADASRSAFLLDDQPLTLADLSTRHVREVDLAYLAACQTATGDLSLLDEALHLAGALQMVGYRHVLATLWNISDTAAPGLADVIYTHLLHPDPGFPSSSDQPQADRAPYALHRAVTHLRQTRPDKPLIWAPYIHLGP